MGKTADLTVVQKTIIDTLHKEEKSQAGCSQSAVLKYINKVLRGREKCGQKSCTSDKDDRGLQRIVKQGWFRNLGELHKEWTEAGVSASRTTTYRRLHDMSYSCRIPCVKPLLNHKQCQKRLCWAKEKKYWYVAQWSQVLFSDESKFCISFGNQSPRIWRKTGEAQKSSCLKSSVKFPQSVMVWGAMSSAGVGPLSFIKSTVNAAVYQEILERFILPAADKLFGDDDFIFQQDLAPAHKAKTTSTWFNSHGITVLDWPANSPDLNPFENLWGIVKGKMREQRPRNADELKANIKATWATITPQLCQRLIASMPRHLDAVISTKGGPTKY
ncbi:Transposable element Tcb1 transposase [Labeo rohita]|uniref:Transposable element Tcb1 transposase n=1 Tax=Labeo rohita TaxID=84645 RepID=A0ABQ8LA65_LABRO|nr:Transposable element Tcb1 transposase [Labeo rohita]